MTNSDFLNYRILMLDLDGTLITRRKHIDKQVGILLKKFIENGGILMFNTGRSLTSALKIKDILLKKYQVQPSIITCFNGAVIYDCIKQEVVKESKIDSEIVSEVAMFSKKLNLPIGIYDGIESVSRSLIIANVKKTLINFINCFNKKSNFKIYDENKKYTNVYKILCFMPLCSFRSEKKFKKFETILKDFNLSEHKINYARPTHVLCEITNTNSTKGKAIPYMIETINKYGYNFTTNDICAIGDSENDLPMFGYDHDNNPTVGLALALGIKLSDCHRVSNQANKDFKKPHLLAKFIKNFVFK